VDDNFDVIVIGAGAIGENVAARAVRGGLTSALIDNELFGGECSYWACMPSKALLRPGHALAAARRLPGVPVGDHLDPGPVLARRDKVTSNWDDASQVAWAESAGITVLRGTAALAGVRIVSLGDRTLTANHAVVICTGSVPIMPAIAGIADTRVWTSRDATSARQVPGRLAVLGGGVVGVEMAQAWARLGSSVDLVISQDQPLVKLEPFAGELVAEGLAEDGVRLHLGAKAERVSRTGDEVELGLADGTVIKADELLIATGRRPATDNVGVETVGLKPGDTPHVDDSGVVSGVDGQWLYAAGDVTGRAPLTHQGKYDARIVGDVIAARARGGPVDTSPWSQYSATADHAAVPQVVFTDPEVGAVGLTAAQAAARGIDTKVVDLDIAVAGSYVHADNYRGKARMVVDEQRRVLVGVTFVGQDIAELLHSATVAIVGEVPIDRLWHAVPSYPTIGEVWLRLLEAYGL
jgi:pyruvate/2-oxoglutarate dehydrogenase complex dihydrolipoamide dehydrogenase (E3) component